MRPHHKQNPCCHIFEPCQPIIDFIHVPSLHLIFWHSNTFPYWSKNLNNKISKSLPLETKNMIERTKIGDSSLFSLHMQQCSFSKLHMPPSTGLSNILRMGWVIPKEIEKHNLLYGEVWGDVLLPGCITNKRERWSEQSRSDPEDTKLFSYPTQLSMKIVLLINKSQITNNCTIFFARIPEHENFSANKYENANYCWHFHIY